MTIIELLAKIDLPKWTLVAAFLGAITGTISLIWQFIKWHAEAREQLQVTARFLHGYTTDYQHWFDEKSAAKNNARRVRMRIQGEVVNIGRAVAVLDKGLLFRGREKIDEEIIRNVDIRLGHTPNITVEEVSNVRLHPGETYDFDLFSGPCEEINIPKKTYKVTILTTRSRRFSTKIQD